MRGGVAALVGGALLLCGCNRQPAERQAVAGALPDGQAAVVDHLLEGESLTDVGGVFEIGPAPGASGEQALLVPPGLAKTVKVIKGAAGFAVDVPTAAKVNVWLRVKWTGTCSNSVIVKAPGLPAKIVGESATYEAWHWVQGPTVDAKAGPLSLELQAREDGIFVDQILVTSDLQRVPVGIEQAPESGAKLEE